MKKLISLVLALTLVISMMCTSVSATETEVKNELYFDATTTGWQNYKKIFCHIWVYGGESFYAWQSKAEACTDKDGDGIWTYDLDAKGVSLEADTLYAVVFSNENGLQTYNLLFDSTVLGDTAYCDDTYYENPEDSSKTAQAAFWRGQDATVFGPEMCITSIGNVVGTCLPRVFDKKDMFVDFLVNKLENARIYSGKSDQRLIDDILLKLDLYNSEAKELVQSSGVIVDWKWVDSEVKEPHLDKPFEPQFRDHCHFVDDGMHSYSYSGPLYYHYENGSAEPDWFLVEGETGVAAAMVISGTFDGFYLTNAHIVWPSHFGWHIYFCDENKFYTLEDAWDKGFADKEEVFTQYLIPNNYGKVIGDADDDDNLSVLDATHIQQTLVGLRESDYKVLSGSMYGKDIKEIADMDFDGEVTILDATEIQLKVAKKTDVKN